jgi:hypothetical protein
MRANGTAAEQRYSHSTFFTSISLGAAGRAAMVPMKG